MLSISAQTFDINGNITLKILPDSEIQTVSRRVSRTATLDGGVSLVDMGYTDSDREFSIKINEIPEQDLSNLKRMMKQYALLSFSSNEGFFTGVISKMNTNLIPMTFTVLIKEKLA